MLGAAKSVKCFEPDSGDAPVSRLSETRHGLKRRVAISVVLAVGARAFAFAPRPARRGMEIAASLRAVRQTGLARRKEE